MDEEKTERLEGGTPFETRVLRELANINQRLGGVENRLTVVEEKVESRMRETRPIWEAVLARLDGMETRFSSMDARLERVEDKFDAVAGELLEMRTDIGRVKKRLPAA